MQTQILIILFICHFLGDFSHLATKWMFQAKSFGYPLYPIFVHASVHAILMWVTLRVIFNVESLLSFYLFLFQLITHFTIDVLKGKMNMLFPELQSSNNRGYWVVFGFDQLLHSLVIITMSFYAIK